MNPSESITKITTGVAGFDVILGGGLPQNGVYLLQGEAGTGKTTLGLQFLLAGVADGEPGLFITLSQTEKWLHQIARSHGWQTTGIDLLNATAVPLADPATEQVILHSADLELSELTNVILDAVERLQPRRLVLDALSYLRLLAGSPLRYRQAVLALQQRFAAGAATVLLLDDMNTDLAHAGIHNLVDGVFQIDQVLTDHGTLRRHLRVVKLRAQPFAQGLHDLQIRTGGLQIFPQLQASEEDGASPPAPHSWPYLQSGVAALDNLLGGGLEVGTSCLFIGAAGTGKTSLVTLYTHAAARQGQSAAIFLFDESSDTFLSRAAQLGMDLRPAVEQGRVALHQISTGELSPAEFTYRVRAAVEEHGAGLVAVDSLTGYINAIAQERRLLVQMHELIIYLNRRGVLSLFTVAQHGLLGDEIDSELDISYIADAVLLLRHFEGIGHVRQAISVFKKRHSSHDKAIRELTIGPNGVQVGETLDRFRHVLSGRPLIQNPWNLPVEQENHDPDSDRSA